jgi:hypothetical protein
MDFRVRPDFWICAEVFDKVLQQARRVGDIVTSVVFEAGESVAFGRDA